MSSPLQRLIDSGGAHPVGAAELEGFFSAHRAPLLIVAGGAAQRAEGDDLAVVASALAEEVGPLCIGVADAEAEPALKRTLRLEALPALVFAKSGRVVTALARIQPWSAYARAAAVVFGGREVRT